MLIYADTEDNGEGLVWGSEVKIEIGSQISKHTSMDNSSLSPRMSTDTDCVLRVADKIHYGNQNVPQLRIDTPHSVGADADDEGSLYVQTPSPFENLMPLADVRGRPRSRTKQLRRRGIDLSRDELRISSRWSSGEKRSMEDFRDAIREKANGVEGADNVWVRWAEKRHPFLHEARMIKNKVAKSLRRSVSRGRSRRSRHNAEEDVQSTPGAHKSEQLRWGDFPPVPAEQKPPRMPLRQAQSTMSTPRRSSTSSLDVCSTFARVPADTTSTLSLKGNNHQTSWQRHLQHDLQPRSAVNRELRYKKGRYVFQQSSYENQAHPISGSQVQAKSLLPSHFFPDHNLRSFSSTRHPLQPSLESRQDIEAYHPLPSLALSFEPDSINPTTAWARQKEQLGDIISSSELGWTWQEDGNTIPSASSSPWSQIPSDHSSTRNLIQAVKQSLNDRFPDMIHTAPLPQSHRKTQATDLQIEADKDGWMPHRGRLVSSMSVPDSLTSRVSSFRYDDEVEEDDTREMLSLALHPLTVRLPHENLVRPSIGAGFKRWDDSESQTREGT